MVESTGYQNNSTLFCIENKRLNREGLFSLHLVANEFVVFLPPT